MQNLSELSLWIVVAVIHNKSRTLPVVSNKKPTPEIVAKVIKDCEDSFLNEDYNVIDVLSLVNVQVLGPWEAADVPFFLLDK